jgi:surface protein
MGANIEMGKSCNPGSDGKGNEDFQTMTKSVNPINAQNKQKSNRRKMIIISVVAAVLVAALVTTLVLVLYHQPHRKTYKITATYEVTAGQKIKLFNPSNMGLGNSQYKIKMENKEELTESTKRSLGEGKKKKINYKDCTTCSKGYYTAEVDGEISTEIEITLENNAKITTMEGAFKDCKDMKSINLTEFDSSKVESMDSLFEGCKSLTAVDFGENANTKKVTSISSAFKGCKSLKTTQTDKLNLDNVEHVDQIYYGCDNLVYANLTNINSKVLSESQDIISSENKINIDLSSLKQDELITLLSSLFYAISNENLNVKINEDLDGDTIKTEVQQKLEIQITSSITTEQFVCETGDNEKCTDCCPGVRVVFCSKCNKGYYLPNGDNVDCSACPDGCTECSLEEGYPYPYCYTCDKEYTNTQGVCTKECEKGENEKCKSCSNIMYNNNKCMECNEGYYLPKDGKKEKCVKCDIEHCTKCSGTESEAYCEQCEGEYKSYGSECVKECEIGENEKCKTCEYDENDLKKMINCGTCNEGYFADKSINYEKCTKCSDKIENSRTCHQDEDYNVIVDECNNGFEKSGNKCLKECEKTNDNHCIECSKIVEHINECGKCIDGYYLSEKKECVKIEIQKCLEVLTDSENNSYSDKCQRCEEGYKLYDFKCYLECEIGTGEKCHTCSYDSISVGNCETCNEGYYLPAEVKTKCESCSIVNCKSCSSDKNGKLVCLSCSKDYYLSSGESGEITCEGACETGNYAKCKTCNEDGLKPKECKECNDGYYLDENNKSECTKIPIENCIEGYMLKEEFICAKCYDQYKLSDNKKRCDLKCTISNTLYTCASCDDTNLSKCGSCNEGAYLFKNTNTESNDHLTCKECNIEHCTTCTNEGTKTKCKECENGYKEQEGFCKETCKVGKEQKCKTCVEDVDNSSDCGSCNDGYYLPNDVTDKTQCISCGINHCSECEGSQISPICKACETGYLLDNNSCIFICTTGSDEKCKTCDESSKSHCGSCNEHYFIPKNKSVDKCIPCSDEHCIYCEGDENESKCTQCEDGYKAYQGKCIKDCVIGPFEQCTQCSEEDGKNNECGGCNEDYYLPTDSNDKTICTKIPINYCLEAKGTIDDPRCTKCFGELKQQLDGKSCIEECIQGGTFRCKTCSTEDGNINKCGQCNDGYYLPSGVNNDKTRCYKCRSNCLACTGTDEISTNSVCLLCEEGYQLYEGECIKNCETGNDIKCKSCSAIPGRNDQCGECNDNYFLPEDDNDRKTCQPCSDDGSCIKCSGKKNSKACTKCKNGYDLFYGSLCKETCKTGDSSSCASCSREKDKFDQCGTCNSGYYIPSDTSYEAKKCYECTLDGCGVCEGKTDKDNKCIECKFGLKPYYKDGYVVDCHNTCDIGSRSKCAKCNGNKCSACNEGYNLVNGKCEPIWTYYATINTIGDNRRVKLINGFDISRMHIDNDDTNYSSTNGISGGKFIFKKGGEHKIKVLLRNNKPTTLERMFDGITSMTDIEFTELLDATKVTSTNQMFHDCTGLTKIDIETLKFTSTLTDINGMFLNCEKVETLLFTPGQIDTSKVTDMEDLFNGCTSIKNIDLSTWDCTSLTYTVNMFSQCKSLVNLDISFIKSGYKLTESNSEDMFNEIEGVYYINITINKKIPNFIREQINRKPGWNQRITEVE